MKDDIMKQAIERAIAGGFEPLTRVVKSFRKSFGKEPVISEVDFNGYHMAVEFTSDGRPQEVLDTNGTVSTKECRTWTEQTYRLIFNVELGFMEALVGKPENCCKNCSLNHGSEQKRKYLWVSCYVGFFGRKVKYKEGCERFMLRNPEVYSAAYHRAQMSNLPDIEAIKQYIKTEIMEVER